MIIWLASYPKSGNTWLRMFLKSYFLKPNEKFSLNRSILDSFKAQGFPDQETLEKIVRVHYPNIKQNLLSTALAQFFELREQPGLKKKPSTSEALDWLKLLLAEDLSATDLTKQGKNALPQLHGALLKNEQDVQLFERLAFMARNQR